MAEPVPKKRKRSSSLRHPFTGTFTRSKSQIYLHRNRSGRSRSDSFCYHKHHANLLSIPSGNKKRKQKSETRETAEAIDRDDWSTVFIKDLRTRRVFSLGSIPDDCVLCPDGEEKLGSEKTSGEIQDPNLSSDSINLERLKSGSFVDKEDKADKDVLKSDVEISTQEQKFTENSSEECAQATPPDTEILQKWSIENINKKDANTSGSKSVISPPSRVEVLKAPGSFSYRRLLPYLMNMVQENSSVPTKSNCLNIENQPISTVEFKVYGNSIEAQAADFVSHDIDIFTKSGDTGSNLRYSQHIADSSMLVCSQKDSCTMVSSRVSLDADLCSNQSADHVNEKIKIGISCKDTNLKSLKYDCSLRAHNTRISGNLNESEQLDGEESRMIVGNSACNHQNANDTSAGIEAFEIRHNCKTIDPNHAVSYVSGAEETNIKNIGDDDGIVDKMDDSNEESIQMRQPDVDMLGKPAVYQNVDKGTEFVSQSSDQVLGKPLSGSFQKNKSCFSDKSMDSSSKRKLGPSLCSQLKLLQNRSSFSYRRLLPYLMDIAKDNTGDSTNGHCPKLENDAGENLLSLSSMSNFDETLAEKMDQNANSCTVEMAKLDTRHASACNQPSLESFDSETEIPPVIVRKQEPISENEGQSSAATTIVNFACGRCPDTICSCSSPVIPKSCDGDILDLGLHESSVINIEDTRILGMKLTHSAKPVEGDSLSHNPSKLEASCLLETPASSFKKGILKRKPRGCKGHCTCLNCASFRLHAERAFEFSKNQMQDAEEVALDLINELSHLRNMLDKAASGCKDNLFICINQVKEACRKASEAEEVAKSRLNQMNYDLEVHCRVTDGERPRVKFANHVEERIIL